MSKMRMMAVLAMALVPALAHGQDNAAPLRRASGPVVFNEFEKLAYLGVTTSPVPPVLRDQLKLPRGFGLVVDGVEADSPAAKAGLHKSDVLQRLGDQDLVNAQQLTALVWAKKAGDKISLTVLREAKPVTVEVTLTEKEQQATEGGVVTVNGPLPGRPADPLIIDDGGAGHGVGAAGVPLPPGLVAAPGMHIVINGQAMAVPAGPGAHSVQSAAQSDGVHSITLTVKTDNGVRSETLVAKDGKTGAELFNGPIDTDDQRKTIPAEILPKVEAMEKKMN